MSESMTIGRSGLVPAERNPRKVGRDGTRWFFVGRKMCNFLGPWKNGETVDIQIPTRLIQRALCLMELQLGRQRAMRKRKVKKGARKR